MLDLFRAFVNWLYKDKVYYQKHEHTSSICGGSLKYWGPQDYKMLAQQHSPEITHGLKVSEGTGQRSNMLDSIPPSSFATAGTKLTSCGEKAAAVYTASPPVKL